MRRTERFSSIGASPALKSLVGADRVVRPYTETGKCLRLRRKVPKEFTASCQAEQRSSHASLLCMLDAARSALPEKHPHAQRCHTEAGQIGDQRRWQRIARFFDPRCTKIDADGVECRLR